MVSGVARLVVPGRHSHRARTEGLRRVCVAALILLVVQYGVGVFLNLYVPIPSSVQHAGIIQEIATAPAALTLHALLGLALIGTAIMLLARAVNIRDGMIATLAAVGLSAIGAAFAAGEIFVRNGMPGASFAMAVLTGVALLCYVGALARSSAGRRRAAPMVARAPAPVVQHAPARVAHAPARAQPGGAYPAAAWPAARRHDFEAPRVPMSQPPASWFMRER